MEVPPTRGPPSLRAMTPALVKLTGIFVTALVVFGTDRDILTALPLGFFAGAAAGLFLMLAENFAGKR